MRWHKVKVGDFLIRVKDLVPIVDTEEYSLVTIKLYHKGIRLRKKVKGTEIGADKMSRVKTGQFILSGIDARNGAFGIIPNELDGAVVTNDFWHFEIDTNIISNEYFLWLTSTPYFDDLCNKASDGTTNRIRLQSARFYSQELMIPEIRDQYKVVEELRSVSDKVNQLETEYHFQLTQIENLNQAILQEAVQGKLVAQDPKDEPASELIKRVKAEKLKLGKKEKSLPSIKSEDIPFEIPANWQWCRMGDAVNLKRGKSKFRPRNDSRLFKDGKYPFIQTGDVAKAKNNNDLVTTINGYYNDFGLSQSEMQNKGTLCITIAANIAECGFLDFDACVPDSIVCLQAIDKSTENYIYHYLKLAKADLERFAPATAQKNINLGILNDLLIPLPPLPEQKRIIAEIEKQFVKIKRLKEYVTANQYATKQLLKVLLRQAFEVKVEAAEASSQPKVIALEPTAFDFCREDILAAEIVWQLHKQPTFGHLKLQKLIYLCQKTTKMDLSTNFLQQAMGPYDPKLMRSLDSTLKKNNWFDYQQTELLKYKSLGNAGDHKADFNNYFKSEKKQIQFLIDNFKSLKSEVIEIVATLYACLDLIITENSNYSEALLIKRFYEWSDEKGKFNEKQVKRVFKRMIEIGIVPAKFTELACRE